MRLFNAETDEMVGEIETALRSPIYNIAMSGNLLILLAGIIGFSTLENIPNRFLNVTFSEHGYLHILS